MKAKQIENICSNIDKHRNLLLGLCDYFLTLSISGIVSLFSKKTFLTNTGIDLEFVIH